MELCSKSCTVCDYQSVVQTEGEILLLFPCPGCELLLYCGKICQKEHWKKGHYEHCKKIRPKQDMPNSDFVEEFMDKLNEKDIIWKVGKPVHNPLTNSGDILDRKLKELYDLGSALNPKMNDTNLFLTEIRLDYWYFVLKMGNHSINFFLNHLKGNVDNLAKYVFNNIKEFHPSFLFNLQLLLVATDYSVASNLNTEAIKDPNEEIITVVKKRKEEASVFFSFWEKFWNKSPSLLSKANSFLLKNQTLDTCTICSAGPLTSKTYDWSCGVAKTSELFEATVENCSPSYRWIDGLGSVASCGRMSCNFELLKMFQTSLTEHSLTMRMNRETPELVYHCDFCFRRSSVHRCSGCKSRWYCGEVCQRGDWGIVHQDICTELGKKEKYKKPSSGKRKRISKVLMEENKTD